MTPSGIIRDYAAHPPEETELEIEPQFGELTVNGNPFGYAEEPLAPLHRIHADLVRLWITVRDAMELEPGEGGDFLIYGTYYPKDKPYVTIMFDIAMTDPLARKLKKRWGLDVAKEMKRFEKLLRKKKFSADVIYDPSGVGSQRWETSIHVNDDKRLRELRDLIYTELKWYWGKGRGEE